MKTILLLALGDIYWTKFAFELSNKLKAKGYNVVIVLESRVGEYQANYKRIKYKGIKTYYLTDFANTYKSSDSMYANANNVMCDYLRVMKHGLNRKLLETNWGFVSNCVNEFASHVFDAENIDLIISDRVSTALSYSFCEQAMRRSRPYWGITGSCLPGRYITTSTIYSEAEIVENNYKNIIGGNLPITSTEKLWGESYLNKLEKQVPDYMFAKRLNSLSLAKFINVVYLKIIIGTLIYSIREREDKKNILIKAAPFSIIVNSVWKNTKRLIKSKLIRKYFINNQQKVGKPHKYFIYPVHYEPEATTVVSSSFYSNQLEIITNLAFSMPKDTILYVKEHVSNLGYPDIEFYRRVKSLPNVQLVWHDVNLKSLIPQSLGVITLTGTAGFEALLMGKPTYYFGNTFYTFHPNAIRLDNWNDCKRKLAMGYENKKHDKLAFLIAFKRYTQEGKLDFMKTNFGVTDSIIDKVVTEIC